MNQVSPEGPNWSYSPEKDSFSDCQRLLNLLWAMGFGPLAPEPPEATDAEVAEAIADLEADPTPTEATDEQVAAIFADESPAGRSARPPVAISTEER